MIDLLTEAGQRLIEQMKGLGNEKWQWLLTPATTHVSPSDGASIASQKR